MNKKYVKLIIWITFLGSVSSALGNLTKSGMGEWYQALNRSSLTPPSYVFGLVWSLLYVMIAISGWKIWESEHFAGLKSIKKLYVIQLILNWSWTPLFFGFHLTGYALACLPLIIICVTMLILKAYRNLSGVSLLLTPYLLWTVFASYLNFYIWQYN